MTELDSNVASNEPSSHSTTGTRAWRIAFLVFCIAGVLLSADLLRLHVKVHTDPGYQSYCAVNEYIDCEGVALSEYAVFGGLPLALWGILGYLFMGGLSVWGLRRGVQPNSWPFGLLFGLSLFSLLATIFLFYISHFHIQSLCIVCMLTYGVNMILFGLAIVDLRKRGANPVSALRMELGQFGTKGRAVFGYFLIFTSMTAVLWVSVPAYWRVAATTGPDGLRVGITPEGWHWIGARMPVVEIIEFSDYQCPYCQIGHAAVRAKVAAAPNKIRLIHRHYPLRQHQHAFPYAMMANCAGNQDRFWEANDYLFIHGRRKDPVTIDEMAEELDIDVDAMAACLENETTRREVVEDARAGGLLRVRATPTYIIGDKSYTGKIPEVVIDLLLKEAKKAE